MPEDVAPDGPEQPSEALRAAQLLGVDLVALQALNPDRPVTKADVLRAVGVTDADLER